MAELRKIAENCNFGSALDCMIRDRLVCGIKDRGVQQILLAENSLTLKKAIDIAGVAEAAQINAAHLLRITVEGRQTPRAAETEVNFVKKHGSSRGRALAAPKRNSRNPRTERRASAVGAQITRHQSAHI